MYTILVVDDEKDIVSALEIYLKAEGYRVLTAYNGREALSVAAREDVHLILMDIMMPVMDGLTAMAQLRQTSNVPVILLTAKGEDTDKVLGLNVGADDYITKPFNPVEMLARVRSQLRRYLHLGGGQVQPSTLVIGGICLDDNAKIVTVDGDTVSLPPRNTTFSAFSCRTPARCFPPARSTAGCGTICPSTPPAPSPCTSATCGRSWRSIPPIPGTSRSCGARAIRWRDD